MAASLESGLALNLLLITAIMLASTSHKATTQPASEGETCPEKLTLDGSCLPPRPGGGGRVPAWLFSSEMKAFNTARCYAACAQNILESDQNVRQDSHIVN